MIRYSYAHLWDGAPFVLGDDKEARPLRKHGDGAACLRTGELLHATIAPNAYVRVIIHAEVVNVNETR